MTNPELYPGQAMKELNPHCESCKSNGKVQNGIKINKSELQCPRAKPWNKTTAASSKDFKIPLTAAGLSLTGISEELISHRENKHWLCIVFAAEEATGGREQFTALPVS